MLMAIKVEDINDISDKRCTHDLLYIFNQKWYINEKGYLTKLVDKLHELGYYKDNESLFVK